MKKLIIIVLVFFFITGCGKSELSVEFNSNGGTTIEEQLVQSGKTATKPIDPIKEGYKFLYWELDNKEYNFNKKINKNLILDAKWEISDLKKYKVTYKIDNEVIEETYQVGSPANEPEKPIKNGYQFLGWFIDSEKEPYNFEKVLNDNITLVAKFKQIEGDSSIEVSNEIIFVTDLNVSVTKNEIVVGETINIIYEVGPANATTKTLDFISSNKRIATVDSSGVIKGIRPGTVTITVKTTDTSEINKTISITVNQK